MARLFGTIEGSKGTASRTGTDLLRARLATWSGAVVVAVDDFGGWTVHTEPADPQEAARTVPVILARGNLHRDAAPHDLRPLTEAKQSPNRRPPASWTPYTVITDDERNAR